MCLWCVYGCCCALLSEHTHHCHLPAPRLLYAHALLVVVVVEDCVGGASSYCSLSLSPSTSTDLSTRSNFSVHDDDDDLCACLQGDGDGEMVLMMLTVT